MPSGSTCVTVASLYSLPSSVLKSSASAMDTDTVALVTLAITGYSGAQTVRCTTWNLEWFPNGSPKEASAAQQEQRIKEAADVLRPIDPDILLLQEVRDYDVCARLGEAIAPSVYHVTICSAFKEPFQRGLGRQQVVILSKYQAQAAWAEPWKSMNGVDPPRGFAFAWFKIGNENIGVYSVHLKSNLITHGDKEAETAKNIQKRGVAVTQLIAHVHDVIETTKLAIKGIVIGGRFQHESRSGDVRGRKDTRFPHRCWISERV